MITNLTGKIIFARTAGSDVSFTHYIVTTHDTLTMTLVPSIGGVESANVVSEAIANLQIVGHMDDNDRIAYCVNTLSALLNGNTGLTLTEFGRNRIVSVRQLLLNVYEQNFRRSLLESREAEDAAIATDFEALRSAPQDGCGGDARCRSNAMSDESEREYRRRGGSRDPRN